MYIPHICHFFTQAKFLENEIYTEKRVNYNKLHSKLPILRVNYDKLHSKLPIFRVKSEKNYTGQKKFTRPPPVALVTNMRYGSAVNLLIMMVNRWSWGHWHHLGSPLDRPLPIQPASLGLDARSVVFHVAFPHCSLAFLPFGLCMFVLNSFMMLLGIVMIICRILHLKLDLLLITELPSPSKLAIQKLVLKESILILVAMK